MKARLVAVVLALVCAAGAATAHVRHVAAPAAPRVAAGDLGGDLGGDTTGGWYDQERTDPNGVGT